MSAIVRIFLALAALGVALSQGPATGAEAPHLRLGLVKYGTGSWEIATLQRHGFDRAEGLVHQYLDLARKASLRPMEALALYNLGELARSVGRFESARAYYLQSLGLHEEFKDTVMQAYCLAGVAECHAREGHRTPARNLMERSQALSTEDSPYTLRAQAWLARGEGRGPEATALFTKALATAKVQAPEIVRELKEALR